MIVRPGIGRNEFAIFELSNRLGNGLRRRAEHLHALRGKRAQDSAADAAAQHGVEIHVLLVTGLRLAQGDRVKTARFGIEKGEESRVRQMRFNLRINAIRKFDGNAELHGAFSRKFRSAQIVAPAQFVAYAHNG